MNATGISRRIDNLGRITIPKEIRSGMRLFEGAYMQFLIDGDMLCMKKQVSMEITSYGKDVGSKLTQLTGFNIVICDTDKVVFATGENNKCLKGCTITESLHEMCEKLCISPLNSFLVKPFKVVNGYPCLAVGVVPIFNDTRIIHGAILLMETKDRCAPESSDVKIVQAAAATLGVLFNE